MRQNRGGGGGGEGDDIVGDRLRYVVSDVETFKRNYGGKESGRFRMLVRRAEKVELGGGEVLEKSEDARAKRIRRFVRRPTT